MIHDTNKQLDDDRNISEGSVSKKSRARGGRHLA